MKNSFIAAIQPTFPRLDVIGIASNGSIWHISDTKSGGWSGFEDLEGSSADYAITATTWGAKRVDIFYVDESNTAFHIYTGNGRKQWAYPEDLGSPELNAKIAAVARAEGYIDLVGRTEDDNYVYKALSDDADLGESWFDLGGDFGSAPTVASWYADRLDVIGIDSGSKNILQRFAYKVDSNDTKLKWADDWIDLGGGPFIGDPFVSTWGPGRLDIWAIDGDGVLNHKWLLNRGGDWWEWSAWEQLGGNFKITPVVVSWDVDKFTIVGQYGNETQYRQKDYYDGGDGGSWHPSLDGWYEKGGDFTGQPAVVAPKGKSEYRFLHSLEALADIN